MARKYSMAHLGCLNWKPQEMIYNAHAIGYDYVSIRPIVMGIKGEVDYDFKTHPEIFRLTKQALADTGMQIHDIELAMLTDTADVKKFESAFELSAELGAKAVISSIWTQDPNKAQDLFEETCDLAAKYGLYVGLEFVTWAAYWNLKMVREVLEKAARPNAGLMIDTLHAYRSRIPLEEIEACPAEWFRFAHVCGGPVEIPELTDREALLYTGREARYYLTDEDNGVPAADYLKAMRNDDVVLSLELPHWGRAADWGTFEHQRRILETTKAYMKAHGIE